MQGHGSARNGNWAVFWLLLAVQLFLLVSVSCQTSGAWDEWRHLPSGLYSNQYGDMGPYCVNPPLTRRIATVPVILMGGGFDRFEPVGGLNFRSEAALSTIYARQEGSSLFRWLTIARLTVIPFSLMGSYLIYLIAIRLYGSTAAVCATTLWVFSPLVIAFGACITPDVSCAVLVLFATWRFYIWLAIGRRSHAVWFGAAFALALLSKSTALLLIPLFTFMVLVYGVANNAKWNWKSRAADFILAAGVCWIGVHACYEFQGVMRPLGEFEFVSQTLSGRSAETVGAGNRFRGTLLGHVPVPLPADYMIGIDLQKLDFEGKYKSYLMGTRASKGWWYYYLVALFLKEPIALWILIGFATVGLLGKWRMFRLSKIKLQRELILYSPGLLVMIFVSSQTGFNHHLRYVLPFYPILFLGVGKLVSNFSGLKLWLTTILVCWYAWSSLSILPHSHAFFTEVIGGHKEGWRYLGHSNLDWGQDLYTIQEWTGRNSNKSPVFVLYDTPLPFEILGVAGLDGRPAAQGRELKAGYWVVSSQWKLLHSNPYFREHEPTVVLSPVTSVYRIERDETN